MFILRSKAKKRQMESSESSENMTRQCIFSQVDVRTGKDLRKGILWWEKREEEADRLIAGVS